MILVSKQEVQLWTVGSLWFKKKKKSWISVQKAAEVEPTTAEESGQKEKKEMP